MAAVLEKVRITGRDSDKEVYHLELSLEDQGWIMNPAMPWVFILKILQSWWNRF
jgi:hypothetical protein